MLKPRMGLPAFYHLSSFFSYVLQPGIQLFFRTFSFPSACLHGSMLLSLVFLGTFYSPPSSLCLLMHFGLPHLFHSYFFLSLFLSSTLGALSYLIQQELPCTVLQPPIFLPSRMANKYLKRSWSVVSAARKIEIWLTFLLSLGYQFHFYSSRVSIPEALPLNLMLLTQCFWGRLF